MPKYIDKDKMIQDIKDNYVIYGYEDFLNDFFKMVDEQPTVDVVKHGHWIAYEFGDERWHKCSVCGTADEYINELGLIAVRRYCPSCPPLSGPPRASGK